VIEAKEQYNIAFDHKGTIIVAADVSNTAQRLNRFKYENAKTEATGFVL
jgi:hypothetical protein